MENQLTSHIKYIAISSQKGGVAKTTTCLSLGSCLAEQGLRVLLVDLDPQAHLTQALSVDPESLRRTIGDVLLLQASILEVSRESSVPNLDLVPANRGLILVEKLLHNIKEYEKRLQTSLYVLNDQYYDLILFDCPPSFGPLTINALVTSSMVIIPVTCDFFSMQSVRVYLNLLNMVKKNFNPIIESRLLITMYDGRTRLSKLFLEQFRSKFSNTLFESVIPLDTKVRESSLFGRPINLYANKARGAREYRALALELTTCLKVTI
jgi:chromosome partitioning protein